MLVWKRVPRSLLELNRRWDWSLGWVVSESSECKNGTCLNPTSISNTLLNGWFVVIEIRLHLCAGGMGQVIVHVIIEILVAV